MSNTSLGLSLNPLIQLKTPPKFRARNCRTNFSAVSARLDNSKSSSADPQLNLSVLRFTLGISLSLSLSQIEILNDGLLDGAGIPGLDESYLPRWIGYGFGSLLILNHFAGSISPASTTPAQLRTEALGLSLAAFSIALPYLGRFLKGATPMDQTSIPQGCEQIFVISQNVSDTQKEDLAWATYILLRNTNTIAVIISIRNELCVRGYWNIPDDVSKTNVLGWFEKQIESIGLSDLKETLYLSEIEDSGLWEMLPQGTRSLLVQPIVQVLPSSDNEVQKSEGFVLLASSMRYAYSDKDKAWIGALANKFKGKR
ncbi:protein COFACTOR ASSEMBLY OF COMPLEX C SUBUNIT B CCB2, chloroplastic isoform X1 [Prunus avium]|uniref:Protein COFACTOR ASSEMBLY OF COMPLEX C SUBUNIT B CCB2, chloroplastic isoform X1 n=1 Tax=Prunus avium TaxID=42229 RepID=A0A6P5SG05_PRUAV|nr:protein COFACTOR ASSEMBLY OF COMPLEX C SUBUNIT B CCB2, chloroplastic isoform X1 [Prunus avium]